MIDNHKQAFIEEATELLTDLEGVLLELEQDKSNEELIAKTFRILHTVKGSSGMFGFDDIAMFTHDMENVFDLIRNKVIQVTKEIIDLTLKARDEISVMLKDPGSHVLETGTTKEIISGFRNIVNQNKKTTEVKKVVVEKTVTSQKKQLSTFLIQFIPSLDIFMSGNNPLLLLNEIKGLGRSFVYLNASRVPDLHTITPENCYLDWEVVFVTDKDENAIRDIFIFVEDQAEVRIEKIEENSTIDNNELYELFSKIHSERNLHFNEDVKELIKAYHSKDLSYLEEKLPEIGSKKTVKSKGEADSVSSLRVSAEKLDELVNLVGELVTVQARLSQKAAKENDAEVVIISEEVERITWALRDSALNIRMLPIGTTFSKFKRLVRDLSKELGKEVDLTTEGAETELDKTVIEKLNDPLVHIIRNSIDHGIEMPGLRTANNKPSVGKINLSATQSGGNVLIKISDDGAGIDKEVIRSKAVALGLISENAELKDNEIYNLLFAAGFSTASKITSVSGRGVGMDVVKRAIENLRGTVDVTSQKGTGTIITLKIPLTLAIIDGLLVKIGEEYFVLPLSSVEECIELLHNDIEKSHGRNLVNIRGEIVPYIHLRRKFLIESPRPEIEQIVIADIKGTRVGFVVDNVVGQHQTVLKTLGRIYRDVEGISGATILGDGTVALILDIVKLMEDEEAEEFNHNTIIGKN